MTNKVTRQKFPKAILNGEIITINNAKNLYDKGHIGKDTEFSCPYHGCNVPLIFCFNPEEKKREPYFRTAREKQSEHICVNRFTIKPIVIEKSQKYENKSKDNQSVVIFRPNLYNDSPSRDNNSYDAVKNIHTTNSQNASEMIRSKTNNDTTTTNMSRLFECRNGDSKIKFQGNVYKFDELFIDLSKKLEFCEQTFYFMYGVCDIKHNNEYYILFNFQQIHCINGQEKRLKLLLRRIYLGFNGYNEFRSKLINISSVVLYIFGTVSPATDRHGNRFISINVKLLNHLHFVSP